jgi:hypothetical protein
VFTAAAFDSLENIGQAQQLLNGAVTTPMTHFVGVCLFQIHTTFA